MLFNITLERAERKAIPNIGGIILQKSVQILAHADDAVMVQYKDMKMQLKMHFQT
jgi:hypothetical protein